MVDNASKCWKIQLKLGLQDKPWFSELLVITEQYADGVKKVLEIIWIQSF